MLYKNNTIVEIFKLSEQQFEMFKKNQTLIHITP